MKDDGCAIGVPTAKDEGKKQREGYFLGMPTARVESCITV